MLKNLPVVTQRRGDQAGIQKQQPGSGAPCSIYCASNANAKSLQLCPTLCDPIDGSLPGSSVPGILQARTLEWVAISFSNLSIYYAPNNIVNTLQMATH